MDRYQSANVVGILGIIGNLVLLIIKAIAGFASQSQSLIADAFNSAGDIFSSCMTFIGNKISSKEADEDHHLGHGKAEYIYSLLISISMFLYPVKTISPIFGMPSRRRNRCSWARARHIPMKAQRPRQKNLLTARRSKSRIISGTVIPMSLPPTA